MGGRCLMRPEQAWGPIPGFERQGQVVVWWLLL